MVDEIEYIKMAAPYVATILLSAFGGTVQHFTNLRKNGKRFRWFEFFADGLAAIFAGILTYFLYISAFDEMSFMAAALISVSGHMGTRAVDLIESVYTGFIDKFR